jgi:hypothetical protein
MKQPWRPMESFPHDGRTVLVMDETGKCYSACWYDGRIERTDSPGTPVTARYWRYLG